MNLDDYKEKAWNDWHDCQKESGKLMIVHQKSAFDLGWEMCSLTINEMFERHSEDFKKFLGE